MPTKQPKIKWRESDEAELERTIRNFNRKIDRLVSKNPDLKSALPEKMRKKDIKNRIENRSDFNKMIRSAERFKRKGSEEVLSNKYGLQITKYERKEIAIKLGVVNRRRAKELETYGNLEVVNQGKKTGIKRAQMGSVRMNALKPKKFNFETMSKQNYKAFVQSLNKQAETRYTTAKMELFKENYIKGLEAMIPPANRNIIEAIRKIPADQVVKTFFEDQNASIDFIYDPVEQMLKLKVLSDIWLNM